MSDQPCAGQPAGEAEHRRLHAVRERDHQRRSSPAANSERDRDPGQDQPPDRRRRRGPDHAMREHERRREHAEHERADRQQRDRAREERAGSGSRRTPAPPVTPITSGEASGLAERALQQRPGDAERGADHAAPRPSAAAAAVSTICLQRPRIGAARSAPSITSPSGTCTAPSVSDAAAAATSAAADSDARTVACRDAPRLSCAGTCVRMSRIVRPTSVHGCSSELPVET